MVMYYNALDLPGQSLQIEDHLLDMIESMVRQTYRFLNKPNVMFDMESVAGRNSLNLLKFHQQKTRYINKLNKSATKHLFQQTH